MSHVDDGLWSHNAHYHRVVLAAVPATCERALDVGCGQGRLARQLRRIVPQVVGIDRDRRSVELARAHPDATDIGYLLGDFASVPLRPESLDFISSVAALHHMDAEAALRQMADLLRPGGVIAVIGLATDKLPLCLRWEIPAIVASQARRVADRRRRQRRRRGAGSAESYQSPIIWPPPLSYRQVGELAGRVLPGSHFRRRLYWRYSLTWTKPG
jgi:SAM-dependent methyltransferase